MHVFVFLRNFERLYFWTIDGANILKNIHQWAYKKEYTCKYISSVIHQFIRLSLQQCFVLYLLCWCRCVRLCESTHSIACVCSHSSYMCVRLFVLCEKCITSGAICGASSIVFVVGRRFASAFVCATIIKNFRMRAVKLFVRDLGADLWLSYSIIL